MYEKLFAVLLPLCCAVLSLTVVADDWTGVDIGAPETPGSFSETAGEFEIVSSGYRIWGQADECSYYRNAIKVSGDFEIIARISSITGGGNRAAGGVMARESLDADAKHITMLLNKNFELSMLWRDATGGDTSQLRNSNMNIPYWVKLTREGDEFSGYHSSDGETYTKIGNHTSALNAQLYIGPACQARHWNNDPATVTLDNVNIIAAPAAPEISPAGGDFSGAVEVAVSAESGTEIRYTTDNSEPNENSTLYTSPITLTATTMLRAKAFRTGYEPSAAAEAFFVDDTVVNGLFVKYCSGDYSSDLTALETDPASKLSFTREINYFPATGEFADSDLEDYVGARFAGKLYIPTAGDYTFTVNCEWAERVSLYIDGYILLDHVTSPGASTSPTALDAGFHDLKILYAEVAHDSQLQLSWQGPGIAETEIVPLQYLFNLDSDSDQLPDSWECAYYGDLSETGAADDDLDGYTTKEELTYYYTDPDNANDCPLPAVTPGDTAAGLAVSYYHPDGGNAVPDFSLFTHFKTDVVSQVNFPATQGEFATSGKSDRVAALFKGYLDIPEDANYTFYLNSGDGAILYIDGETAVDNDGRHGPREHYDSTALQAGLHELEIGYYKDNSYAFALVLEWSNNAGLEREVIPAAKFCYSTDYKSTMEATADADGDGLTDPEENALGTEYLTVDSDGDGLSDFAEVNTYHTDPLDPDSDDDGVGDYDETMLAFTDPNSADFGEVTGLQTSTGSSATVVTGQWSTEGDSIYARTRNGELEYNINISSTGSYRVEVEGRQHELNSSSESFLLECFINGSYLGASTLIAPEGNSGKVHFYLPELAAGSHTVNIKWINIASATFLEVMAVRLQSLGGPDANENGVADWLDNREAALAGVNIPATSKSSPVCLEGEINQNLDMIAITGFYTPPGETPVAPVIIPGVGNRWYSDVTLDPGAATDLTVSFQNGAKTANGTVSWTATNVIRDADMNIRRDDSLLLTGYPEGAGPGSVEITVESNTFNTTRDGDPVEYKFENTGEITVSCTYTPDGGGDPVTDTLTVKVVACSLGGDVACVVNVKRPWSAGANIPADAVLDKDSHLLIYPGSDALYLTQLKDAHILARLGEAGPVLDSVTVYALEFRVSDDGFRLLETYEDNSQLIEGRITLSQVPADLKVRIRINTAGITLDDGTTERWLEADDFDENGNCYYRIIKPEAVPTAACHSIYFFDDDIKIATE